METEIKAALVHGEFKLYHGPNVHTNIYAFVSFSLADSRVRRSTRQEALTTRYFAYPKVYIS